MSTVIHQTIVNPFNNLLSKLEELSLLSPHLQRTTYLQRLQQLAPKLTTSIKTSPFSSNDSSDLSESWIELTNVIDNVKEILVTTLPLQTQLYGAEAFRAVCTPFLCPSGATQEDVDVMEIAVASADIAAAIAQGVAAAIPQEAAGIPNPAYLAAIAVATALDVVTKGLALDAAILQKEANKIAACEQAAFQQIVYSMCETINEIKKSLDKLHSKTDLLDKKINILLTQIANLETLSNQLLFLEIEEYLASCKHFTSLYLPNAAGGHLETVQNHLASLITSSKLAGLASGMAEAYLKQGVLAVQNKRYCTGLFWFSLSYKQLTDNACCQAPKKNEELLKE